MAANWQHDSWSMFILILTVWSCFKWNRIRFLQNLIPFIVLYILYIFLMYVFIKWWEFKSHKSFSHTGPLAVASLTQQSHLIQIIDSFEWTTHWKWSCCLAGQRQTWTCSSDPPRRSPPSCSHRPCCWRWRSTRPVWWSPEWKSLHWNNVFTIKERETLTWQH